MIFLSLCDGFIVVHFIVVHVVVKYNVKFIVFYQSSLMSNEHIQCIVLYCFIFQVSVKQEEEFRRQKRRRPFIWRSNSSLEILADTMHVPQGMVIVFSLLSGLKLDRYRFLVCVTLK